MTAGSALRSRFSRSLRAQLAPRGPSWALPSRYADAAVVARAQRGQLIRVVTDVSDIAMRQIRAVAPATAEAMDEHLRPVAERADAVWPVRTGLSLTSLVFAYVPGQDTFRAEIFNGAPYAIRMKFRKKWSRDARGQGPAFPGQHVWTTLLDRPVDQATDDILNDIADGVTRAP